MIAVTAGVRILWFIRNQGPVKIFVSSFFC